MKILITGANGLLGGYLAKGYMRQNDEVLITGRGACRINLTTQYVRYVSLDICDGLAVDEIITSFKPDMIIHGAAVTQVDYCEQHPVECWNTNVTATRFIIEAAKKVKAFLVFISTDFVFNGEKGMYTEEDSPSPVNYYGSTKVVAEKAVKESGLQWAIIRTVLVYGLTADPSRTNIITWVRDKLGRSEEIKVVNDQVRTPTYAGDLAGAIIMIGNKKAEGVFHISGKDVLTPYDIALLTAEYLHLDKSLIIPVNASIFTQPALRPPRTGFNISKARKELNYEPVAFDEGLRVMLGRESEK